MIKIYGVLLIIIFLIIFNGCKSSEIDGGWVNMDIKSKEVIKAVEFLKEQLRKKHPDILLTEIVSAESQIVAGQKLIITANYKSDITKEVKILKAHIFITIEESYILEKVDFK